MAALGAVVAFVTRDTGQSFLQTITTTDRQLWSRVESGLTFWNSDACIGQASCRIWRAMRRRHLFRRPRGDTNDTALDCGFGKSVPGTRTRRKSHGRWEQSTLAKLGKSVVVFRKFCPKSPNVKLESKSPLPDLVRTEFQWSC